MWSNSLKNNLSTNFWISNHDQWKVHCNSIISFSFLFEKHTVCMFILSLPSSLSLSWISDIDKALKEQKMRDPQWDRAAGRYTDKGNADRHRPTHTYTHVRRKALSLSVASNNLQGGARTESLTSIPCSVMQKKAWVIITLLNILKVNSTPKSKLQ